MGAMGGRQAMNGTQAYADSLFHLLRRINEGSYLGIEPYDAVMIWDVKSMGLAAPIGQGQWRLTAAGKRALKAGQITFTRSNP
jgi:hypothetical protein